MAGSLCGGWCNHGEANHYRKRREAFGPMEVYCRGCGNEPCVPRMHSDHKKKSSKARRMGR